MSWRRLAWCGPVLTMAWCTLAIARPQYMSPWQDRYPTSTIPSRMADMVGNQCFTCHHPPGTDTPGNCYKSDLTALIEAGSTITEAIDQLDAVDSDGDGVLNGVEAVTPRDDLPDEVGYSMGLVGELGTDPCSDEPDVPVTGVSETPPTETVPGDCDGDGVFDLALDLPCFVDVLLGINEDPDAAIRSDLNGDGQTDGLDIQVFVVCAINGCP